MSRADAKTLARCSSHNCRSPEGTMLAAWHCGARLIRLPAATAHGEPAEGPSSAGALGDLSTPVSGEISSLSAAYLRQHGGAVRGQARCFSELTGWQLIRSRPCRSAISGAGPERASAATLPVGSVAAEPHERGLRLSPLFSRFGADPAPRSPGVIPRASSNRIIG